MAEDYDKIMIDFLGGFFCGLGEGIDISEIKVNIFASYNYLQSLKTIVSDIKRMDVEQFNT